MHIPNLNTLFHLTVTFQENDEVQGIGFQRKQETGTEQTQAEIIERL
jgi:hypothetical protein